MYLRCWFPKTVLFIPLVMVCSRFGRIHYHNLCCHICRESVLANALHFNYKLVPFSRYPYVARSILRLKMGKCFFIFVQSWFYKFHEIAVKWLLDAFFGQSSLFCSFSLFLGSKLAVLVEYQVRVSATWAATWLASGCSTEATWSELCHLLFVPDWIWRFLWWIGGEHANLG